MLKCDKGAKIVSFLDFQRWLQEMHGHLQLVFFNTSNPFSSLGLPQNGGLHTNQYAANSAV